MSKAGKKNSRRESSQDAVTDVAAPTEQAQAECVEYSELLGVPFLGAVRAAALANAGISRIADLRAAAPEVIGSVKGVGLRNAERIKAWLAEQPLNGKPHEDEMAPPDISDIDGAVSRIREANPKKGLDKRFTRQLNKVLTRVSGVPAAFETLGGREKQQAVKALDRIALLLAQAAERGRLSDKKQHTVGGEIKARLKKLDKALDD